MANFGGVYFLHFFQKTTQNALKWQFLLNLVYKLSTDQLDPFAILRHLEWFLEKMAESRPLAILGGVYFLHFFPKTPVSASKLQYYL